MPASIAVLADVHGNLPALEAVLAEVEAEEFDLLVSAGDVVSGPMPVEVLERLEGLSLPTRWVRGNADRHAARPAADSHFMDRWAHERLSPAQRARVHAWPSTVTLDDVLVCHAVPANDEDKVTMLTPAARLASFVAGVDARLVIGGHVHHQFTLAAGTTTWINAGSVGMPYEGRPGAYWLSLRDGVPELRRTAYDAAAAIAAVRATGYGEAEQFSAVMRGEVHPREAAAAFEPCDSPAA